MSIYLSEDGDVYKACGKKKIKKEGEEPEEPEDADVESSNEFEIAKFIDDEQLVFGWASIAKNADGSTPLDWQGDVIMAEDLEKAVYPYVLDYREANADHRGASVGRLVESVMFTKQKMQAMGIPEGTVPEGWWLGYKIDQQEIYSLVKSGKYKMFSIEGSAKRVQA